MNGPFGNRFPYTNFHEMNLDWMIQIAKDFLDQYTNIQNIIEQGESDLNTIITNGLDDLQTKYETLEGLLNDWYTQHSEDIADQLADALGDLNAWYTEHQDYLDDTLASNIAAFTAEAQQIRDNTVETIPADYTALSDSVLDLELTDNVYNYGHDYLIGGKFHTFERGKYYSTPSAGTAITQGNDANFNCAKIAVTAGDVILINVTGAAGIQRAFAWMDSDGNSLGNSATSVSGARFIKAPADAVYLVVNNKISVNPSGYFAITGNYAKQAFSVVGIEQGTYNSTYGSPAYTLDYSRTPIISVDDIFEIVMPSVEQFFIYRYDEDGNYISRDGGTNGFIYTREQLIASSYTTASTKYVAFAVKVDGPTTPEDLADAGFSIQVMNKQYLYGEIQKILKQMEDYPLKSNLSFNTKDFEQGGLDSSGNEGTSYVYCRTDFIDINTINILSKPLDIYIILATYASDKTFIARTSLSDDEVITMDQASIQRAYNPDGNVKYVRFAVKRTVSGEEIESLPSDIINSDLVIELTGASGDIYEQIRTLKNLLSDEATASIPSYYDSYLATKIYGINTQENTIASSSDNFIFITDYHYTKNAQHSPEIIKKIVSETGITKLIFGGDAGISAPLATMYRAAQNNCKIYQKLSEAAPEFYPIIGNHEWNDRQDQTHEAEQQAEVYNRIGVYNYYVRRCAQKVQGMSAEGNYYIDSDREKIRYFFLQVTGQAKLSNDTIEWLGNQLLNTPNGYYVCVFSHYAYTGGDLSNTSLTGRGNQSVIRVTQLLGALKTASSVTVNTYSDTGSVTGTLTFNYGSKLVYPIGIISGHTHWDAAITANDSEYGILTIATTCDAFNQAQDPVTHDPDPRQVGTVDEQAFDVVQIDLTNRKVYMTRIGGGDNREFTF